MLVPSWFPKTEPRHPKIYAESASTFNYFLRPLGTGFFRPERRQDAPTAHRDGPPGGMRGSLGEDPPAHLRWSVRRVVNPRSFSLLLKETQGDRSFRQADPRKMVEL